MDNTLKAWFINQVFSHSKRSIIISILLTILLGLGIQYVYIDDDFLSMLPKDQPTIQTWERILDEFGSTERIFVAFGNPGESAINSRALTASWDLSHVLKALPTVDDVRTISTMNRIDSDEGFLEVSNLQPTRIPSPKDLEDISAYLETNPEFKQQLISQDGNYLNIMIQPKVTANTNVFRDEVVTAADSLLKGFELHYGGTAYLTGTMPALIRNDVIGLVRIGMVIMVLILLLNLRSVPALGMMLSVIFMSLVAMMGFMGWIVHLTGSSRFYFGIMNASMPIILLTIAVADGVHIITKFFREAHKQGDQDKALRTTMNTLMLPIFLTSLTTIAAFLSITAAPIKQFTGYGLTIGVGIAWAWFLSVLYLPSMIRLKNWDLMARSFNRKGLFERASERFGKTVLNNPKPVMTIGLVLVITGIIGIGMVKVEVNIANFFKPGNPIRDSMDFIDREMTGAMDLEIEVNGDIKSPEALNKMVKIQDWLEKHERVTTTMSIADVIRQMHRTVMDDDPAYDIIPDTREKVNNLFTLYSMSGDPEDFNSLVDYDYRKGLIIALMRNQTTSEIKAFTKSLDEYIQSIKADDFSTVVTGMIVIMRDFIFLIVRSSFISIGMSLLVVFGIAWIFFRRFIWAVLAVVPLTAAIILNFGFMGLFGVELSHVTALLSSIIIGVGVDFAIHYIAQYRHYLRKNREDPNISREVMGDVGYPILLNAASNMGFGALLVSSFVPVQYIGGLMVFAMVSTSVGTLTLLATIIAMSKNRLASL